jgi:hypothetical protein
MSYQYSAITQQQQTPERHGAGAHKAITGAVNNGGGLVRITAISHGFANGAKVDVTGIIGTTEANGVGWVAILIDANTFDLTGSAFVHAYISGGLAVLQ